MRVTPHLYLFMQIQHSKLMNFLKSNVKEYDTVFVFDENDEFTYDSFPIENVKIFKSNLMLIKAQEVIQQVNAYVERSSDEMPDNIKFYFITNNKELYIPARSNFELLLIVKDKE